MPPTAMACRRITTPKMRVSRTSGVSRYQSCSSVRSAESFILARAFPRIPLRLPFAVRRFLLLLLMVVVGGGWVGSSGWKGFAQVLNGLAEGDPAGFIAAEHVKAGSARRKEHDLS